MHTRNFQVVQIKFADDHHLAKGSYENGLLIGAALVVVSPLLLSWTVTRLLWHFPQSITTIFDGRSYRGRC